jgi:hypothetical protein
MTLLERVKATIFGVRPPLAPRTHGEADVESSAGGARDVLKPDVSTPADDPALHDIAAAGVQPVSKPVEIEEAQNPRRRTSSSH